MAAGNWTFTSGGRTSLLDGTFDIDSDTWKMALFISTSNLGSSSTTFAGVTNEVSGVTGYTAGGVSVSLSLSGTTTVTVDVDTDPTWSPSADLTWRFQAIYEVSGNILVYSLANDTPADETVSSGNVLTVQINASGVFTLA